MRQRTLLSFVQALFVLGLSLGGESCLAADADDAVKIEKLPPVIDRRQFNPWLPFGPRPKLEPGQKAFTECPYNLSASFDDVELVDQEDRHGRWFVNIKPKGVRAKLSLPIVIWTPQGAPQKCLAHEEGHRVIAERIYEFAGDIIKCYATQASSNKYRGEGADPDLAVRDAYKRALTELNQNYKSTVVEYFTMVTDEYDRLTNHGLLPVKEEDAINQSFERCSSQMTRLLEDRAKAQQPRSKVNGPVTKIESAK